MSSKMRALVFLRLAEEAGRERLEDELRDEERKANGGKR